MKHIKFLLYGISLCMTAAGILTVFALIIMGIRYLCLTYPNATMVVTAFLIFSYKVGKDFYCHQLKEKNKIP